MKVATSIRNWAQNMHQFLHALASSLPPITSALTPKADILRVPLEIGTVEERLGALVEHAPQACFNPRPRNGSGGRDFGPESAWTS
ncbi:MAG: hypothetical protein VCD50_16170, partial [Alphaproteobacteria bacterium]